MPKVDLAYVKRLQEERAQALKELAEGPEVWLNQYGVSREHHASYRATLEACICRTRRELEARGFIPEGPKGN